MTLGRQMAFVDDAGDSGLSLDNTGTSSHFVLAAVIVDESNLVSVESKVESVRAKHFQTGEMKSSKVAGDDDRRMRILHDLRSIDWHVLAIVVDKDRLSRAGGLRFHGSFVKFLSSHIHRALYSSFPGISVVADQHSNTDFMQSFEKYISMQLKPTLFDGYSFCFANSKSNVLLQLADFLCGTIARGYEVRRKTKRYKEFVRTIEDKITSIKEWPGDYESYLVDLSREYSATYDSEISGCAIRLARDYINRHEDSDTPELHAQVRFLEFLLFKLRFHRADLYVSTREIREYLSDNILPAVDTQYVRSNIVAPLRDSGVLVASSPKGYKIPVAEKDLYDFVNHSLSIVKPMLGRLQECRGQISIATKNRLDVFDQPEYGILRRLLND